MKDGCHYDKATKTYFGNNYHFLSLLFTIIYIDDIQKWFNQYTDKLTQNHKGQGHSKLEDFLEGVGLLRLLVNINIHHLMVSIMVLILHCQKVHQLKRRRMVK